MRTDEPHHPNRFGQHANLAPLHLAQLLSTAIAQVLEPPAPESAGVSYKKWRELLDLFTEIH